MGPNEPRCTGVFDFRDMGDKRVEAGPALGRKKAGDGLVLGRVGPEAIDRLGWKRDKPAAAQSFKRARKAVGVGCEKACHRAAGPWRGGRKGPVI